MGGKIESIYAQTQQLAEVAFNLGAFEQMIKDRDLNREAINLKDKLKELYDEGIRLDNAIRSTLLYKEDESDISSPRSSVFTPK